MKTTTLRLGTTDSTNRYLRDYAANRPTSGDTETAVVAVADYQTSGHGQGDNPWESEAGKNLLFSILTYPTSVRPRQQFVLSMAMALAVADALGHYTDGIRLKWPNDVYRHDSKISGTLIETRIVAGTLAHCISGTGINVNQRTFRSDAPNPVSLYNIIGRETPIEDVLHRVLDAYGRYYDMVLRGEYDAISDKYHAALYRRNEEHLYEDGTGRFTATLTGVDEQGRLLLQRDGGLRAYSFKEVRFVIAADTARSCVGAERARLESAPTGRALPA